MKRFIWISLAILGVLIVFIVVGKQMGWLGDGNGVKVSTTKPEKRTIVEKVIASGKIYPTREVKISPDVAGEIIELYIVEGDSVHAGQELARIKPDIYMSMLDRAVAALNTAKANQLNAQSQLTQLKAQQENAQKTFQRNKQLYDQKVISAADFEQIETQYKSMQAQYEGAQQSVDAARFGVESAQAGVKEARDNLSKTSILAPIDGIVSQVNVERGERVVGTAQFAGTEMFRIADLYAMEARVDISENDVLRVEVGDTAEIDVAAYPDKKFYGIVTEIANSANTLSGVAAVATDQVTNFTVKIAVNKEEYASMINTEQKRYPLLPGMSAQVEIRTRRVENILSIPIQAVTARTDTAAQKAGSDDKTKELVFVYSNEKVKSTEVQTGIQDDQFIEIKSGLSGNEEVVEAPYSAVSRVLRDGSKVQKVSKDELYKDTKKKED
jgi:HlyD family secretion protein